MLSSFFQLLYLKVLVSVVVKRSKTIVYIESLNAKGVVNSEQKSFNATIIDEEIYEFITSFTKESPYYYISVLDSSLDQGALPTCSRDGMASFHDISNYESRCYRDKWSYYTSKAGLDMLERKCIKIGVDFIFSPFLILNNFFSDKIDTHKALYLLIEESYMSLMVFDNSELLYAQHLDVEHYKDNNELFIEDNEVQNGISPEDTIDLDEIDALDDLDDLDDFANIEDLDSLEDMDEFAQAQEEEPIKEEKFKPSHHEDQSLNEDYQRFLLIQSSIKNFYKDSRYKSEFIEYIYIADTIKVSRDLKKFLEEEMFLSVYVRHMDLPLEVCTMTKLELQ